MSRGAGRIGWWRSRGELRAELDEEFEFHLEQRIAELERRGYTTVEARAEASRRFGDVVTTRSDCLAADERRERRQWRREYLRETVQDAVHGLRQLGRRPAFTVVAVLTLGLGVGANAAIFGVADHVLLRPLPFAGIDRIVTLWETDIGAGDLRREPSPGNYLDWRERATAFAALGLVEPYAFDVLGDGPPESVPAWLVADGWFEALGVRPLLGRTFAADDAAAAAPLVAVISEGFWRRRYGGDRDVIGRSVRLDEGTAEIIGVVAADQLYPQAKDVWVPKQFRPAEAQDRRSSYMPVVARLKPGVTVAQAQAQMDEIAGQLALEHPQSNRDSGINVVPLREQMLGEVRPALLTLLGAVTLLLLIACTNLASLLLARGAERRRELAVRAALGAGRARLVRQLLTESAVLSLLGCLVGLVVAWLALSGLAAASPPGLPRMDALGLDLRVATFLIATTVLATMLFGTLPALRYSRADAPAALRGGRAAGVRERHGLRAAVVTAEIALAIVLLVGAGLLTRSFVRLLSNELGFATEQRAYLQLFVWDRNPTAEERSAIIQQLGDELAAVPGVRDVAAVSALPFHPNAISAAASVAFDDRPPVVNEPGARAFTTVATPAYFRSMGIPLRSGRSFTAADRFGAPLVAVVNETFARLHFPGEDPIGRRVTVGVMGAPASREIVGVAGDVRPAGFESDPRPELFVPHAQHGTGSMTFVIHAHNNVAALMPSLRARVWNVDPSQSIYSEGTMASLVGATVAQRRFYLVVVGLVSLFAFVLTIIGVYGLISFWTRMRVQEIGVRLALGARHGDIVRLVVVHALRLAVPGLVLGLAGALAFSHTLQHMLYETPATEPVAYAQIAALMLIVSAAAAYLPARRALAHDPLRALQND